MRQEAHEAHEERDTSKPVIVFRRTRNKGRKPKYVTDKQTKEKTLVMPGEHVEDWNCSLADDNGELHPWATTIGIQQYVNKGYIPIDLYGFEEYFQRKDPNQDIVRELVGVYRLITGAVGNMRTIDALQAQVADLHAQLQEALKGSSDPKAQEQLKKLEAQARDNDERHAKEMKKLQEALAAQTAEIEEARKSAAAKKDRSQ